MKGFTLPIAAAACLCWVAGAGAAPWDSVLQGIAQKAGDTAQAAKPVAPSQAAPSQAAPTAQSSTPGDAQSGTRGATAADSGPPTIKTYQNYDFVPGNDIVFEDDFRSDQDGEFPAHRLSTKGFGASKPIASNDTLEGKAQNRRVELVKL